MNVHLLIGFFANETSHLHEKITCQYMEILSCMLLTYVVAVCSEIHKKLWLCVSHQQR